MKRYIFGAMIAALVLTSSIYMHHVIKIKTLAKIYDSDVKNEFSKNLQSFLISELKESLDYFSDNHKNFYRLKILFPSFKHEGSLIFSCDLSSEDYSRLLEYEPFIYWIAASVPSSHEGVELTDEMRVKVLRAIIDDRPKWLREMRAQAELPGIHQPTDYQNAAGIRALLGYFDIVPENYVSSDSRRYQKMEAEKNRLTKIANKRYERHMQKQYGKYWRKHEEHWGELHVPPQNKYLAQLENSWEGATYTKLKNTRRRTPIELCEEYLASRNQ